MLRLMLVTGLLTLGCVQNGLAGKIDTEQAVRAIVGEGASQSFKAQTAIACVIRNRGSLQGVYGANNKSVAKASMKTLAIARQAWQQSATNDVTHGIKFFGCQSDYGYFRSIGLHPAFKIDGITFWK